MLAFLVSALLCAQDFEYRQGGAIVDPLTNESRTPQEFLKYALELRDAGKYVPAVQALSFLVNRVPEPAIRETAHFERSATFYKAGAYYEAYHDSESFILRFPQSERITASKKLEMSAALALTRVGKSTWFGLSSSSATGIDYLHA